VKKLIDEEEVKQEIKAFDEDIEAFTEGLGVAIFDLNKKHSNTLYRTNLYNSLSGYFYFMKKTKEEKKKKAEEKAKEDAEKE